MSTTYPNLGLVGAFTPCEDALSKINENFKTLDNLVLQGIDGIVSSLPGSPAEGDAVILDSTNQVNVYVDGAWEAYSPQAGWMFVDTTDCSLLIFDGTDWKKFPLPQDYVNFLTGAGNVGSGVGVFAQVNAGVAEFKSLVAGTNITITDLGSEILIQSTSLAGAQNLGAGEEVFKQVNGLSELEFKTLVAGLGITMTSDGNEITINSTSSSTKVVEQVNPSGGVSLSYVMSPTSLTDLFLLNGDVDAGVDFEFSDPTLTTVGKTVTIKNTSAPINGYTANITATNGNNVEQNHPIGSTLQTSFGATTLPRGEAATYTNDGTNWYLISRVKY